MRLINKLLWYWLQQPDEMHLAATWYLIPVSTAPCYTHDAVKWQPHGSETSRHSHELPTQSWAVAWAKSWAMLVLSYPFEKGVQPSYHCFAPTGEIGTGLALRVGPDWLCHGVPLGKFLNSSVPQFPHQEKKKSNDSPPPRVVGNITRDASFKAHVHNLPLTEQFTVSYLLVFCTQRRHLESGRPVCLGQSGVHLLSQNN